MAACSIILSQVVYELNHQDPNESNYKFGIYPIVKKEKNQRMNKVCDFNILRLMDGRTFVIIEVKL